MPSQFAARNHWTRLEQHEHLSKTIAGLEIAAANHDRLVHEFEQAAAAHKLAARKLRARIGTLAVHQDAEMAIPAVGEIYEEDVPLSQYPVVARLLGPFEVSLGGKVVEQWRSQRAASLMKYLLLYDGRPVRREVLMNAFWPFSIANAARNNLNVAVYSLRRTLNFVDPAHPHVSTKTGPTSSTPAYGVGSMCQSTLPPASQVIDALRPVT